MSVCGTTCDLDRGFGPTKSGLHCGFWGIRDPEKAFTNLARQLTYAPPSSPRACHRKAFESLQRSSDATATSLEYPEHAGQ